MFNNLRSVVEFWERISFAYHPRLMNVIKTLFGKSKITFTGLMEIVHHPQRHGANLLFCYYTIMKIKLCYKRMFKNNSITWMKTVGRLFFFISSMQSGTLRQREVVGFWFSFLANFFIRGKSDFCNFQRCIQGLITLWHWLCVMR